MCLTSRRTDLMLPRWTDNHRILTTTHDYPYNVDCCWLSRVISRIVSCWFASCSLDRWLTPMVSCCIPHGVVFCLPLSIPPSPSFTKIELQIVLHFPLPYFCTVRHSQGFRLHFQKIFFAHYNTLADEFEAFYLDLHEVVESVSGIVEAVVKRK